MSAKLRVCLIASSRFPIGEPFAGGLEAHTHALARQLTRRGHHVSLFAAPGSDPDLDVTELPVRPFQPSPAARADVGALPEDWMIEHHGYLSLMLDLHRTGATRFDVVHNNSLHHLPVAMASAIPLPMVTTLHTPPLGLLESAITLAPHGSRFVAVSRATARSWASVVGCPTIHNGVDVETWRPGPGGGPAVWFGRIVPEKAPHHAIIAARAAGVPLVLCGPVLDPGYFDREVAPRLSDDVRYLGHLDHIGLREVVGAASVAVVTPEWDEPYGLVSAEALACGTPVAAYARGAMPEIIDDSVGALARPGDIADLARAIARARWCDRRRARQVAEQRCSVETMVDSYVAIYRQALVRAA